jgi:hypothetical protein
MSERPYSIAPKAGLKGYTADGTNASPDFLAPPSVNCLLDEQGLAETRLGFEATSIDLTEANKPARSFYLEQFDVTVFALGSKVKYYDWNVGAVYDTGLTLTDGTITRSDAYTGDVYLTNTTDGLRRLVFGRLNDASATLGDATVTVDSDMAARLSVFGLTSGNLRIQGTTEAFSSLVVATGVVTLTGTLSQSYSNNAVCLFVSDISSTREKASKVFFWKERMGLIGSEIADNADQPNATVYFGKFATALALELIIDFTYGAGGSTRELVGKWGRTTNVLPTKDYLYVFKERGTYVCAAAEVVIAGTAIGQTTPDLLHEGYGCLNEDSAIDMGYAEIAYITGDKRIMRIKISTDSGAPVVFPDEGFDVPMRKLLRLMDSDQTGAVAKYHQGRRRAYFQIKIQGQWLTLVYDNNIRAWQPPQTGKIFSDLFERKGTMYGTSKTDDTVFMLDSTLNDNGQPIECYICSGVFDIDDSMVDQCEVKGTITPNTIAYFKFPVNNDPDAQSKMINGTDYVSGDSTETLGSVSIGSSSLGGDLSDIETGTFKKVYDVYPSEGNKVQFMSYCFGDSHHFGVSFFRFNLRKYESLTPSS